MSEGPLLGVEDLTVTVEIERRAVPVVEGVCFAVGRGRTMALVGESGCGKTMTALSLIRLLPEPAARVTSGRILFDGVDLLGLDEKAMRRVRGGRIGYVFQEPAAALDPVMSCGAQVAEAVRAGERLSRRDAWARSVEAMDRVGIPGARERAHAFPHELSGGLIQRVMLAIALASDPDLLIADEPTASLDVTIQAQILDLLRQLRAERALTLLLITHDLSVAAETADEVAVMYAGRIVEFGTAGEVLARPGHPYTAGLLEASPRVSGGPRATLRAIPGAVPKPGEIETGCRFEPRCPLREKKCREEEPPLASGAGAEHPARCWFSDRLRAGAAEGAHE